MPMATALADDVNGDGAVNDADKTLICSHRRLVQDAHALRVC